MELRKNSFLYIIVGIIVVSGVFIHGWMGHAARKHHSTHPNIDVNLIADKENIIPIAIIGSGPAGLSAALYGARGNTKTVVINGNKPGGLLTETSYVENWPGSKSILGSELIHDLKEQALHFGAFCLDDAVERVDFSQWPFVIYTEDGKSLNALSIIIATGATPRTLHIPGEQEYWGKGVTTCAVCDAPFYKNENVVVIGGGDSAVEEAIQLSSYAKKVTILVRKDHMRAAARMQERLAGYPNVNIIYNVEVQKIVGNGKHVTGIELLNNKTQNVFHKSISGVFLAIGHEPNTALFKQYLDTDEHGYIVLQKRSQATSMAGVFAAGDVEDSHYRQAGVAAGEGIKAALDAIAFLTDINFNAQLAAQMRHALFEPRQEMLSQVKSIATYDEFEHEINANEGPVVVDFFADYCPSCMQMLPIFESVAQHFAHQATFVKVDAEKVTDVVKKFFVYKVPCLLVFSEGKVVARYNTTMGRKELSEFVEQFIAA